MNESLLQGEEFLLQKGSKHNSFSFNHNLGGNKSMSMVSVNTALSNAQGGGGAPGSNRSSRAKKREDATKSSPVYGCITVTIAIVS